MSFYCITTVLTNFTHEKCWCPGLLLPRCVTNHRVYFYVYAVHCVVEQDSPGEAFVVCMHLCCQIFTFARSHAHTSPLTTRIERYPNAEIFPHTDTHRDARTHAHTHGHTTYHASTHPYTHNLASMRSRTHTLTHTPTHTYTHTPIHSHHLTPPHSPILPTPPPLH